MYFCRVCNKKSPTTPCVSCGAVLTEANEIVNCPACGKMFFKPKHNIKCTKCGADIIVEEQNVQQTVSNENSNGIIPPIPDFSSNNSLNNNDNQAQNVSNVSPSQIVQESQDIAVQNQSLQQNAVQPNETQQAESDLNKNVNETSQVVNNEQSNENQSSSQDSGVDFFSLFSSVDDSELKSDDDDDDKMTSESLNFENEQSQTPQNSQDVDFASLHSNFNENIDSSKKNQVDENGFEIVSVGNSSSNGKKKKEKKSKGKEEVFFGEKGEETVVKGGKGWKIFALIQTVIVLLCLGCLFFVCVYPKMTDPYQRAFNDYMDGKNYYLGIADNIEDETNYVVKVASEAQQSKTNEKAKYVIIKAENFSIFLIVEVVTELSIGSISITSSKVVSREFSSLEDAKNELQKKVG